MARLHLVRHGLSAVVPDQPPHRWPLDPAGLPAVEQLRSSGRLPHPARWYSSPEPKALETARWLTTSQVSVVEALREHERHTSHWFADAAEFQAVVRRAFDHPDQAAFPGWEPLAVTRDRLLPAVRRILADHPGAEIVLIGHGTGWTLLKSELTGTAPDLEAWHRLKMPDLWVVDVPDDTPRTE